MRKGTISALAVLCVFAAAAAATSQESPGTLARRVADRLGHYYATTFEVSEIGPGNVRVKGEVPSYYDKLRVDDIAARVRGVTEIVNEVHVVADPIPDDIIRSKIREDLSLNAAILEPGRIEVAVDHGTVILSGTVSFDREKKVAEEIASWGRGVKSVGNEIRVLTTGEARSDANLEAVLREMVKDRVPLRADRIHVSVTKGKAVFSGTVETPWERAEMTREAWRLIGVRGVQNDLRVVPPK